VPTVLPAVKVKQMTGTLGFQSSIAARNGEAASVQRSQLHSCFLAIGHQIAVSAGEEEKMPIINIVITLIIVGVGLYLINRFIPMASSINTILNAVVVIAVCVWVLQAVGLLGNLSSYRLTR
jgi:predicted membrane protein